MQVLIENWKQFGCPLISTETGTFNDKSEWLESPENATENGYQTCRAALERLTKAAKKTGAVISIEPYWRNVIDSIARAQRVVRDVPGLKLVMDPCNYFRKEDLSRMDPMLEEMFRALGQADRAGPRQRREGRRGRHGFAGVRPGGARLSAVPASAGGPGP